MKVLFKKNFSVISDNTMDVAVNTSLVGLSLASLFLYLGQKKRSGEINKKETSSEESSSKLLNLQRIYLPAHLLALFSDWLQGPYVFQLYKYHGHGDKEIAVMFLAGYLSSCVFGTLTGPMADRYGRKCLGQVNTVYSMSTFPRLMFPFRFSASFAH